MQHQQTIAPIDILSGSGQVHQLGTDAPRRIEGDRVDRNSLVNRGKGVLGIEVWGEGVDLDGGRGGIGSNGVKIGRGGIGQQKKTAAVGDGVGTAGGVEGQGAGGIDPIRIGLGAVDRVDGFGLGVVVLSDAAIGDRVPENAEMLGIGGSGQDQFFEVRFKGKKVVGIGGLDQGVEINPGGLAARRQRAIAGHGYPSIVVIQGQTMRRRSQ